MKRIHLTIEELHPPDDYYEEMQPGPVSLVLWLQTDTTSDDTYQLQHVQLEGESYENAEDQIEALVDRGKRLSAQLGIEFTDANSTPDELWANYFKEYVNEQEDPTTTL